jgi:hypothetical protein
MTHDEINSCRLLLVEIMGKKKPDGTYEARVQQELDYNQKVWKNK